MVNYKEKSRVRFRLILLLLSIMIFATFADICKASEINEKESKANGASFSSGSTFTYFGHKYKPIFEAVTWKEANKYAKKKGGHLVSITSEGEQKFLESLIQKYTSVYNRDYWTCGTDRDNEGYFRWLTGEKYQYENWYPGQPNNDLYTGVPQNYITLNYYPDGAWDDCQETKENAFIIEWDGKLQNYYLNSKSLTLRVGRKKNISIVRVPEYSYYKSIKYKSKKPGIATINKNGKIAAKRKGKTVITVTIKTGKKTIRRKCKVTVI